MSEPTIDYEYLSKKHVEIVDIITHENWKALYIQIEVIFTNRSPAIENEIAHIIYEQLDDAKKLDEFFKFIVEQGGGTSFRVLSYIIRSGDLSMFKKLYGSDYFSDIEQINWISKTADNSIITDYIESESYFLNPQQKDACIGDKIVLPILTRQSIAVPIKYFINLNNPNKTITNGMSSNSYIIRVINLESDNLGRGITNFVDGYNLKTLNANFFQKNTEFLESLTTREIIALSGYTHLGDRLVNILLRKTGGMKDYIDSIWPEKKVPDKKKLIPIYYQLSDKLTINDVDSAIDWIRTQKRDENFYRIIEECVENYVAELKNIFAKAPRLENEMYVFRGTQNFYYGTDKSDVFINGDFTSTTISPKIAMNFTEDDCCFTQMKLRRGMKAIFIEPVTQHPGELEILIAPGNRFRMIKNKVKKFEETPTMADDVSYKEFACSMSRRDVRFTLMEAI